MQFLPFSLSSALLLQILTASALPSALEARDGTCGVACAPKPSKLLLKFDDIPTSESSDFSQLGNPGGVPYDYNGFQFIQEAQWYAVACTHFPTTNPYYKSCGGTTQAIWTPGVDASPVATLWGPAMFGVDSFWITPVVFNTREVTVKVTGTYVTGGTTCFEKKITTDQRNEVKGLRSRGFDMLNKVDIRVIGADGAYVAYVLDEVTVRKWETKCDGAASGGQYDD